MCCATLCCTALRCRCASSPSADATRRRLEKTAATHCYPTFLHTLTLILLSCYCCSDFAEATRRRLEEAAARKEAEEREKAAQRYQRKEYRTGKLTGALCREGGEELVFCRESGTAALSGTKEYHTGKPTCAPCNEAGRSFSSRDVRRLERRRLAEMLGGSLYFLQSLGCFNPWLSSCLAEEEKRRRLAEMAGAAQEHEADRAQRLRRQAEKEAEEGARQLCCCCIIAVRRGWDGNIVRPRRRRGKVRGHWCNSLLYVPSGLLKLCCAVLLFASTAAAVRSIAPWWLPPLLRLSHATAAGAPPLPRRCPNHPHCRGSARRTPPLRHRRLPASRHKGRVWSHPGGRRLAVRGCGAAGGLQRPARRRRGLPPPRLKRSGGAAAAPGCAACRVCFQQVEPVPQPSRSRSSCPALLCLPCCA